jgi:hypothetical protein
VGLFCPQLLPAGPLSALTLNACDGNAAAEELQIAHETFRWEDKR